MTVLWFFIALTLTVFVGLVMPYAWEEHKRAELERSLVEFIKGVQVVSISVTATRRQVMELVKELERVNHERR